MSAAAKATYVEGMDRWANPSSPHADGRAARAALEDARARIRAALGWDGAVILTSGASEAIAIALGRARAAPLLVSPVEHDAVLRCAGEAGRLAVDGDGCVILPHVLPQGALVAVQQVNNETGVIQPIGAIAQAVKAARGVLFCDAAQGAGKLPLPLQADMIAIGAHKFGGPPGVGALLVRDLALLHPSGGQEQGYRGGTENLPGVMAMAAALEDGAEWLAGAATLRAEVDAAIKAAGGIIVAERADRIPTIASYRMPGVQARVQMIRFDMAGISISAGAACSSGSLKTSPVLTAMGWDAAEADEVIRVSFGRETTAADVARFVDVWCEIAGAVQ